MTKRRSAHLRRSAVKRLVRSHLRLEPLEARRLLAGLQVSVFVDQDASRSYDESVDSNASNRLVFIDVDGNGKFDANEPVQVTGPDGIAFFEDLEDGDYSLGILTNPISQQQTTSVRIASEAVRESRTDSQLLITTPGLDVAWSFDPSGVITDLADPNAQFDLGGPVIDSVSTSDQSSDTLLLIDLGTEDQIRLFNTSTGSAQIVTISGLEDGDRITQLERTSQSLLAVIENSGKRSVFEVQRSGLSAQIVSEVEERVLGFAGSEAGEYYAKLTLNELGESLVSLGPQSQSAHGVVKFADTVKSLQFSADGTLLFATMLDGGINVLNVDGGTLIHQAILSDATGPVSATANDSRVLTASDKDPGKVLVWDRTSWTSIGSSKLPRGNVGIETLVTDQHGDRALVAGPTGVFSLDLALPTLLNTSIAGADQAVELGVRVIGENTDPDVGQYDVRDILEDAEDSKLFDDASITDADGDTLWFSLAAAPANGEVTQDAKGDWQYSPDENFAGTDSATFLVHDGLTATELVVQWEIEPVNDPPIAVHIQLPAIPENPEHGTSIGFISIVDPDVDAEYRVTTSDDRFRISGGQIFFENGELDFDAEPNVAFQVVATDAKNPDYTISTQTTLELTNVNEPPTAIDIDTDGVEENTPGAEIGTIDVMDPDADSEYEFEVSDDRFEIVDGVLRLINGQSLDYEARGEISVEVTATEVGSDEPALTEELRFSVIDANDLPSKIDLKNASVESETEGAIVGELRVDDADGDSYQFQLSDSRFEVDSNVLKLRDGEKLLAGSSNFTISVTARTANGDTISNSFPISVLPPPTPYQNPINPHDVNGDGKVTPLDVLEVINEINNNRDGKLPSGNPGPGPNGEPPNYVDVDGDNWVTPKDVLWLINELNKQNPHDGEGEGDGYFVSNVYDISQEDLEKRRRNTASIDSELELLLEQLSKHRHQSDS